MKTRGVQDILIAVVDGLKGFSGSHCRCLSEATVQTCIVHLLRHSLDFVSYKDRRPWRRPSRAFIAPRTPLMAKPPCGLRSRRMGTKISAIGQSWRRAWSEVIPFYAFHPDVRRLIYTTNAIEALNSKLRRAVRARGHFPTTKRAMKLLFLVLNKAEKEWTMPAREWSIAKAQFRHPVRRALYPSDGVNMFNRSGHHGIPDSPVGHRQEASSRDESTQQF